MVGGEWSDFSGGAAYRQSLISPRYVNKITLMSVHEARAEKIKKSRLLGQETAQWTSPEMRGAPPTSPQIYTDIAVRISWSVSNEESID